MGGFWHIDGDGVSGLAKLDKDGNHIPEFGVNFQGAAVGIANPGTLFVQSDGKLLVSTSGDIDNIRHTGLIRYHATGVPDTEINNTPANWAANLNLPESDPQVQALATQPNKPTATSSFGKGLTVAFTNIDAGGRRYGYNVMHYDFADAANFKQIGHQPIVAWTQGEFPGVTDDPTGVGAIEYDHANQRYYTSSNINTSPDRLGAYDAQGNLLWTDTAIVGVTNLESERIPEHDRFHQRDADVGPLF